MGLINYNLINTRQKMNKISSNDQIKKKIESLKFKKKKIGINHGVIDLIHLGHIRHFKEAKNKCDVLIVSVTSDKFVNKGPGRPRFNESERMEALAGLECIDYVILSNSLSAENNITLIKPNFYFKGPDYKNSKDDITGKIKKENKLVKLYGGKTIFTSSKKYSSTLILNNFEKDNSIKDKLKIQVKKKFSLIKIKQLIDQLRKVNPLVVGEIIIDEYNFCEALGKSGKEPMLVVRDLFSEYYLGGSGAIANHLSYFNDKVNLISYVGEKKDNFEFIKKKLNNNIKFTYIKKSNSPTILKKRFIDEIVKSKILGLYSLNDTHINIREERDLINKFNFISKSTDLTILSDYGHGLITKKFAEIIKKKSKFIAANAQINAANIGHHSLNNYKGVDLMMINEKELRHEMRSRDETVHNLMKKLCKIVKVKYLVVTRGSSGCILYNKKETKFYYSDAYSNKIIDKVGAGDSMLSILAICIFKKFDLNLALLISSFCAAQSVKTLGNKVSINKSLLIKDLEHYLS